MSNAQGCINNLTDITRATHVGEKAWHIHKYTEPLATDRVNLEEDLQLISSVASDMNVKIFGSDQDYQLFDKILSAWSKIDWSNLKHARIVPFKIELSEQPGRQHLL
ncbi:MAG: hypothetical protein AJITA_00887 [Acetilactobacillus jinshanensis]